jgi:D-erythronate 2-dehydrogenase
MHVLVTGAAGYVGAALAARLQSDARIAGRPITRLSLLDLGFGAAPPETGVVHRLSVDLQDLQALSAALGAAPLDAVFHLASIPGGMAESHYTLARRVNLDATLALLERCQAQVESGAPAPRFVFASSIAVFGAMPSRVTDDTLPRPTMTYGAQKLVGEVLVEDFRRRGWVDGRSLRLPGVLARPPARTGQLSAFLSDMIRELAAGRRFTCPMSPGASTWASSLPNVVDNLIHAAQADGAAWADRSCLTLPTLRFSMAELVEALAAEFGSRVAECVEYQPVERIEALFGHFPPLDSQRAEVAGFRSDGELVALVRRSLVDAGAPNSEATGLQDRGSATLRTPRS